MTSKATIESKDNGYFVIVRFGCGCVRRINTEDIQFGSGLAERRARRVERYADAHSCAAATRDDE